MTTDVRMILGADNIYDLELDEQGDLSNGDFFDTSLTYALLGERRASPSEVPQSQLRRGWIGNQNSDFENGSKLWLFEQARKTQTTLNGLTTAAFNGVSYFIEDGLVQNIEVNSVFTNDGAAIEVVVIRFDSEVDRRFFKLWDNTGVSQ